MALRAFHVTTPNLRVARWRRFECVENHALRWIDRRELDFTMRDMADEDVVVEINSAGYLGTDPVALKARLREDQQLRIDIDIEFREQAWEECQLTIPIVKLGLALDDPLSQYSHRVAARRLPRQAGHLLAADQHRSRHERSRRRRSDSCEHSLQRRRMSFHLKLGARLPL